MLMIVHVRPPLFVDNSCGPQFSGVHPVCDSGLVMRRKPSASLTRDTDKAPLMSSATTFAAKADQVTPPFVVVESDPRFIHIHAWPSWSADISSVLPTHDKVPTLRIG
jgi:hypothetical protein